MMPWLHFARQSILQLTGLGPAVRPARKSSERLQVECLETRCLLSLAPASDYQIGAVSLLQVDFSAQPVAVASGVAGADGLTSFVLGNHRFDLAKLPRLDTLPLPSNPRGNWPPSSGWGSAANPPADAPPAWSDQGGPIDLGDLTTQPADVLVGENDAKEIRDVIAVLAELSYVPGSNARSTTRAADADARAPERGAPAAAAAIAIPAEGGLLTIKRGQLTEPEQAVISSDEFDSWLHRPVQMESKHGRFQAFEISTADQLGPQAPAPVGCDPPTSPPPTLPLPTPARPPAPADDVPTAPPDTAGTRESETDNTECGEEELIVAQPCVFAEPMSLALNVAAAIVFASITRAAQSAAADDFARPKIGQHQRP